jgi:hypothetical protein
VSSALFILKLNHVYMLECVSTQLRDFNILVSFDNYGASFWWGTKSNIYHKYVPPHP